MQTSIFTKTDFVSIASVFVNRDRIVNLSYAIGLVAVGLLLAAGGCSNQSFDEQWVELFDGKTTNGWQNDLNSGTLSR